MIYIGEGQSVSQRDVVLIIPAQDTAEVKAYVYLADGRILPSAVSALTLRRRIEHTVFG